MSELVLSALYRYPLKSGRGEPLIEARLDQRGIEHDRRWMLVDDSGRFLSQRELPRMALVSIELGETGAVFAMYGMENLNVSHSDAAESRQVTIWNDTVSANDMGDAAVRWFSEALAQPCRLVKFNESVARPVDPKYDIRSSEVGFADGFPLLIIGQASLDYLNSRLEKPVAMNRFRPNIVISGAEPFAEDGWKRIGIGDVELDLVKPCQRCSIPAVNPETAARQVEPNRTLRSFRERDGHIYFGQNAICQPGSGLLHTGDAVTILA